MYEILLALVAAAALLALGAVALVPWEPLMTAGVWMSIVGLVMGVPPGVVYHVLLYRALRARGPVDRRWIWKPFEFHARIDRVELRAIVVWAWAGAAGFVIIVLGFVAVVAAMISAMARGV